MESARLIVVLLGIGAAACGSRAVESSGGNSGTRGTSATIGAGTSASGSTSRSSMTVGVATEAASGRGTASASAGGASSGGADSATRPPNPPGAECTRPPSPGTEPEVPEDCEPVWLIDEDGEPLEGSPSGLVRCFPGEATKDSESVVFRTAAVACPELLGEECLCDTDCDPGSACICANEATYSPGAGLYAENRCFPADCAGSDECGEGACRVDDGPCGGIWFPQAIRCTTASDDCDFDSECARDNNYNFCDYDEVMEFFTCEPKALCE